MVSLTRISSFSLLFTLILVVPVFGLTEQRLHDAATLVSNTEYCGRGIRCEAIFTIEGFSDIDLQSTNFRITFEDKDSAPIQPSFTTDYIVGTLRESSVITTQCQSVIIDGQNTTSCQNVTMTQQEIIWHGKKILKGQVNYVKIWSDDFSAPWVDWHVLIENIGVDEQGKSVSFDTHKKGWAVWSMSSATTLTTGLVAYYNCPNTSSCGANAVSGGTTLTANGGAGSDTGLNGLGLAVDTSTKYWNATSIANGPTGSSAYTFCSWVKLNSSTDSQSPWSYGANTNTQAMLFMMQGNAWVINYYGSQGTWGPFGGANVGVTHCIARNGTGQHHYQNGVLVNTSSLSNSPGSSALTVGRYLTGSHAAGGVIDELGIWNRALSAAEIQEWQTAVTSGLSYPFFINQTFTPQYQRQVLVNWNSTQAAAPSQVTSKSVQITVDNTTFNNTAKANFGDLRVKMVNTSNNDTAGDYKLNWINATHANITITVNSDPDGAFNSQQKYFFVWGNSSAITTSNNSMMTDFASAPKNWTFGPLANYSEGAPGSASANESQGRAAILQGVQNSAINGAYTAAYDRQVYIRLANGSQYHGRFDVFVSSGNKRWAFNYDQNTTANFPAFANITPVFYVWQEADMTNSNILTNVSALINSTA